MLIFDIETNGLFDEVNRIHCIVIKDTETHEVSRYDPVSHSIEEGVKRLQEAEAICGHNIIKYDIPAIRIVYPWFKPKGKIIDTLVLARVAFADIKGSDFARNKNGSLPGNLIGSHSLEAYGYRMKAYKDGFGKTTDWKLWSPEMSDYCEQDVLVTELLLKRIEAKRLPDKCVNLEHEVARILWEQEQHGFLFDVHQAGVFHAMLLKRREELVKRLQEAVEPWIAPERWSPKGGAMVFTPKRDNSRYGYTEGSQLCKVNLTEFNPASTHHIGNRLQKLYGWKPTEFTETGVPKCDEEVLKHLDYPIIPDLLEFMVINKRLGQLVEGRQGWLKNVDPKTHRIHGGVNSNGAVTGRMTHMNPNMAQVPAVHAPYGRDCRSLFTVPPGKLLVGADASGIELRCLAHYMSRWDDGEYIKIVTEGDVHTENMKALGIDSRDTAKRFIYAFLYGAGLKKLAEILEVSVPEAKKIYQRFMSELPALGELKKAVMEKAESEKFLYGLDGRKLNIRSPHSALNTLLQSAGALLMKNGLVINYHNNVKKFGPHGERWAYVANVHDEWQIEVDEEIAELVGEDAVQSIKCSGKDFDFRCPLDGEYKIGRNWAETH